MKFNLPKGSKTRALLLGGVVAIGAGGGFAMASARHAPRDPASMPELRGTVAQYDLSPRGDVDGLILADGTEVHFPPHLGAAVQAAVKPGDAVTIRGERSGPVVRAGSVASASGGAAVVDRGPPPGGPRAAAPSTRAVSTPMDETGIVKMTLHGPRGDVNGALLQSGTIFHLPPKEAARLAGALRPGQTVAVRGDGVASPAGRSIGAREFGPSMDKLARLATPAPRPPKGSGAPGGPDGADRAGPGAPAAS